MVTEAVIPLDRRAAGTVARGFAVVDARRTRRERESPAERLAAGLFYHALRSLTQVEMPSDTETFCLMDRKVVEAPNAMPERNRFVRGLRAWVGFRQTAVPFVRRARGRRAAVRLPPPAPPDGRRRPVALRSAAAAGRRTSGS